MGFLSRAIERKAADPLAIWAEMMRAGRKSKAGPTINMETAIKVSAFFGCLKVLSQGCAQIPFKLFQEAEADGLTKILPARKHYLYDKVTSKPNDWQTSFEFREQLVIHAGVGNAYVWKNAIAGGKYAELILLDPGRMVPEQPDEFAAPRYRYTLKDGKVLLFPMESIWHIRGPSWSGFAGLDVLSIARDALGLSIATEESHAKLHEKGVRPSGIYSVEATLNPTQYRELKAWIEKDLAGDSNAGTAMILDKGAKWLSTAMTGIDAQHLETRRLQIEEVCRFMGVSPHKVYSSDKTSTYASAEQFNIQHVVDSLSPWYARIEQSADINLLTDKERTQGYYFKFQAAGLMRGALKDQGEFFARALGAGGTRPFMTQDEIRSLLELNPFGGDAGLLIPPVSAQPTKPEQTAA